MGSLFEKLGGAEFVDRVVDNLYVKMVADSRINPFLVGADLKEQALQLKMFLTYQLGGLVSYSGKSMRAAHQEAVDELGLNDEHYDAVVDNLALVMAEMEVDNNLVVEVVGGVEALRNDVLCR